MNRCSGNGICTTTNGEYQCSCSDGWMGPDCSVPLETNCSDEEDNDRGNCNDIIIICYINISHIDAG